MDFNNTVDLNKKIQESSFTVGWLLESLRTYDELYIKLHGKREVKKVNFCLFNQFSNAVVVENILWSPSI